MSVLTLADVKKDLRLTHDEDDVILQAYLDAAEDEALRFMDRTTFFEACPCEQSSEDVASEDSMPHSVKVGVFFLVRSMYEVADPAVIAAYRHAAETILMPYRCRYGV